MIAAAEALARLREGNARFASGRPPLEDRVGPARREAILSRQEPIAIVLGCSDSRVPPELIFGQGLGDLFVLRGAGHVVTPVRMGTIEAAVEELGTGLVVVLGHSGCGAVNAVLENMGSPLRLPESLRSGVEQLTRSVEEVLDGPPAAVTEDLLDAAVRANIRASVEQLRHGSPELEQMVRTGRLLITGAEYSLKTGLVHFLEE
ncbi:MAG TPA: carbonic anhydrase [Thermoanaerobaculia bacterium]|nr:carbonic anhydrase [Thermoanaerobaculia bacterium]